MPVEQGSKEWLDMKFTHFGGSYAPIIMNASPYSTPHQLWQKMLFKIATESTPVMERGKILEPIARGQYEYIHAVKLTTPVVQSDVNSWAIASLDGCQYDADKGFDHVIEIKCYGAVDHDEIASKKIIPEKAVWQLVHVCWVLDIPEMTFINFNPDAKQEFIEVPFYRNQTLEQKYLPKLAEFMDFVRDFKEPPRTNKDYYDAKNNPNWLQLESNYLNLNKTIKTLEEMRDRLRDRMIDEANGMSVLGEKVRLTRITNRGRIRYESIPELQGMDLDQYRGISYITHKITEL